MKDKRLVNFRYIFYPFLAFLFGIIVARGLYSADIETLLVVIAILFIIGIFLFMKKKYKIMAILFAFFFIGNGFYFLGTLNYNVKSYEGEVSIVGRVSDNFEENDYYYMVVLDDVTINGESAKNIKATFSKGDNKLEVGDILTFQSEVTPQSLFTLGSLNLTTYRQNVGYTLSASTSDLVIATGYTKFDEDVRLAIKDLIYSNMSEDNAAIAYAVLFGDQSGISYEVNQSYRDSGIIHIIAVSGFNIGFLIAVLYTAFSHARIKRLVSFIITCVIIVLYAYFCGFAPSVVRASIMGIVTMSAQIFGRRYDALNSLGLSGFIILLLNPLTAFDVGFLMSVFCVIGIVSLSPLFIRFLDRFLPTTIASYIAVSFSAQIAILPFLASFGSTFNLLSFIINLFVIPLFAVMYPYLFFISFLSLLLPFLSVMLVPVDWILSICYFFAYIFSTSALQIKLIPLSILTSTIFYFLVFTMGELVMIKPMTKFFVSSMILFLCVLSFGFCYISNSLSSSIVYLNSYNQESVLLVSKSGQTMVVGDNYLLSRVTGKYNLNRLDIYVTFDSLNEDDVDRLEEYGFSHYICTEGEEYQEGIFVARPFQLLQAGDFYLSYLSLDGNVIGLLITFDQTSVFVASEDKIDYNNIEIYQNYLNSLNIDIAFLGDDYSLANSNFLSVGANQNSVTNYNFAKDGNLRFDLGDNISVRRLD